MTLMTSASALVQSPLHPNLLCFSLLPFTLILISYTSNPPGKKQTHKADQNLEFMTSSADYLNVEGLPPQQASPSQILDTTTYLRNHLFLLTPTSLQTPYSVPQPPPPQGAIISQTHCPHQLREVVGVGGGSFSVFDLFTGRKTPWFFLK